MFAGKAAVTRATPTPPTAYELPIETPLEVRAIALFLWLSKT